MGVEGLRWAVLCLLLVAAGCGLLWLVGWLAGAVRVGAGVLVLAAFASAQLTLPLAVLARTLPSCHKAMGAVLSSMATYTFYTTGTVPV